LPVATQLSSAPRRWSSAGSPVIGSGDFHLRRVEPPHYPPGVTTVLDNVSLSKGEVFGSEVGKKEQKAG